MFDGLLAYSSTKQSVKMSEIKRQNRRDDPMDVDALSKGKRKGKKGTSGSGNGKGQNNTSNVRCAGPVASLTITRKTVDRSGHRTRSGWETEETARAKERKARAKARAKAALRIGKKVCHEAFAHGDEDVDGWIWSGEQAEGWWKGTDDQECDRGSGTVDECQRSDCLGTRRTSWWN